MADVDADLWDVGTFSAVPASGSTACVWNVETFGSFTASTGGACLWPVGDIAASGIAPVIQNVSPAASTEIEALTPVEFDVLDLDPGLRLVLITLKYENSGNTLLIFNGVNFVSPFSAGTSSVSAITNGLHFSILPSGGWAGNIEELFVYAVDTAGNLEGLP